MGTVYVTGHRVFGKGPMHLAIEYNFQTISAGPVGVLGPLLVSDLNRASDKYWKNITLGTVTSRSGLTPSQNYDKLKFHDGKYSDKLIYVLFAQPWSGGYNSNGFVRGIIEASNSSSNVDFTSFVGGNAPVPTQEF